MGTARTQGNRVERRRGLELITIIFIAVTALATGLLWWETRTYTRITQKTFEATNRSYVGVANVQVAINEGRKILLYELLVDNVGSIPAREVNFTINTLLNSVPQPGAKIPDKLHVIFPRTPTTFGGAKFEEPQYSRIINEGNGLEFTFTIKYKGATEKQFCTFTKGHFDRGSQRFLIVETTIDDSSCL